jgi:hypothetical protein
MAMSNDELNRMAEEIESLREDRAAWRRAAQQLARDFGDIKYADTAYEDALEYEDGIPYA